MEAPLPSQIRIFVPSAAAANRKNQRELSKIAHYPIGRAEIETERTLVVAPQSHVIWWAVAVCHCRVNCHALWKVVASTLEIA